MVDALPLTLIAVGTAYAMGWFIWIANNTRAKRALYLAKELEKQPDGLTPEELERWKNELGRKK